MRKPKVKKHSENKIIRAIKHRIIRDIKNPVRVSNFYSNNDFEYETNGDRINHVIPFTKSNHTWKTSK